MASKQGESVGGLHVGGTQVGGTPVRPPSRSSASLVSSALFDKIAYSTKTQTELQRIGGARLVLSSLHDRVSLSTGARALLGACMLLPCW
jgi:hypothetical protein